MTVPSISCYPVPKLEDLPEDMGMDLATRIFGTFGAIAAFFALSNVWCKQ